jgi:hypothetical protein
MTKNDIIRMAREAGAVFPSVGIWHRFDSPEALAEFANLVAAHKTEVALAEAYRCGYKDGREAAAVICENLPVQQDRDVRDECAAAIRERTKT